MKDMKDEKQKEIELKLNKINLINQIEWVIRIGSDLIYIDLQITISNIYTTV